MEIPLVYYGGGNFISFFYEDQDNKTYDLADAITKCNGSDLGEFTWKDSGVQDGGGPNDETEISNEVKEYLKNMLHLKNNSKIENNSKIYNILDHIIKKYGVIREYKKYEKDIKEKVEQGYFSSLEGLGLQQSKPVDVILHNQVMKKLIKYIESIPHVKLLNCNK